MPDSESFGWKPQVVQDPSMGVALEEAIQTILRVERALDGLKGQQAEQLRLLVEGKVRRRDRKRTEMFIEAMSRACLTIEEALEGDADDG